MNISEKGLNLIKYFEGLVLTAYKCPAGVLTIGWGHTGSLHSIGIQKSVYLGLRITEEQATELLRNDIKDYERAVNVMVKVPLTQAQFDALVSFTFNCGTAALKKSTLLKRVNLRETPEQIEAAFKMWNKGGGKVLKALVKRRDMEAKLFNTGVYYV